MASMGFGMSEGVDNLFSPYNHFWAIDRSVGWGCENYYDDVLLIQYLINSLKITNKLEPDGIFGNKTCKAIARFQNKFNQKHNGGCLVDGKVNAVDGSVSYSHKSGAIYSIYLINYWFLERKRIFYPDIRADRELPQPLLHILFATGL